ncbi:MAG: hypothetical protein BWY31_02226 [Lentisphaerae bacterium ADurb.Bin242]|nr:MAG: hypothetical protein BWY31_02226 [Lentisphaerae bacterium ADurb.Bin242]
MKKLFSAFLSFIVASSLGAAVSNATLIRLSPMPEAPVIDGKIAPDEWKNASTTFGGISAKTGLMTYRKNNFRFGYDAKNLYFAVTGEQPLAPQKLTGDDTVEFRILPPGKEKPFIIRFDSTGKGAIPAGVKVGSGFAQDLLTCNQGKCWTAEATVPLSALGIDQIRDGEAWGLQMIRHWSSDPETGYWHQPKTNGELGTFIPDAKAPAVSFDGFGYHAYEATGNYAWSYRAENPTASALTLASGCYMVGIDGAATLDIENPDLIGKAEKKPIGGKFTVAPGKTERFDLYQMAQFPGQPRLLYSQVKNAATGTDYYKRAMFWDVGISRKAAVYGNRLGLPYLCAGFYPSYGNRLRVATVFDSKLPCVMAVITVKDANGKVWKTFKRADFGRPISDFEEETVLPDLPLGEYTVTLDASDADGKHYTHERTFALRKFPWQGLNIGMERVIIPPFKPLQVDRSKNEVHALLTGYRLGGALWNAVYAEGENILAGPVEFRLDGKPFDPGKIRLVSAEKDRVLYASEASKGNVKLELEQEYDYDGFCKVTVKVIPQGKVKVNRFELRIPLKNEVVKYYVPLDKAGARAKGAPDLTVPSGEGKLEMKACATPAGRIEHYFWFGGIYKGICWMMDTARHFSLDPKLAAQHLSRENGAVTYTVDIVNTPVTWEKPFELVMGFEPTPVKPQPEGYRRTSEWMWDYPPARGADFAGMAAPYNMVNNMFYPHGTIPNGDMSYYQFLFQCRNKIPTEQERRKFADDYFARNGEWIARNMPLTDPSVLRNMLFDKRKYGQKYFLLYQNPAFYSSHWPEAEMYKAEWLPWDYPVDDAANEYVATHTKEYIDKLLYEMRGQARMGYDGMNFDCFPLGGGFNTVIGAGYRARPGKVPFIHNGNMLQTACSGIVPGMKLFGWRELTKRTATMLYVENKLTYGFPWVELHATHSLCVPVTAFCTTTITWERGSGGGEYQTRFPESYILADMAGTQSGIIPRPIVSTKGAVPGVSKADEIKTMIAVSFGFALMNHCDQGVERNHENYAVARDAVFTFGYGAPGVKTLPFYGREKQPVTCNAATIRMTQVVRPDGKALLMIGNMGGAVKADFDLSGLGYGKCKVTDVFTGRTLEAPSMEIPRHGYALLQVEKQ